MSKERSFFLEVIPDTLRRRREFLGLALVESIADWDKYSHELAGVTRIEFARRETFAFVDYLAAYFSTGDETFRDLYIGEKLKQCHDPRDDLDRTTKRRFEIITADYVAFSNEVIPFLDQNSKVQFTKELDQIRDILVRPADKVSHVLFIGDCLFLDLLAFITGPLKAAGIEIAATFVTSKLISEQHEHLQRLATRTFDLVFYSPLTYAFNIGFSQLQFVRTAVATPSKQRAIADAAIVDIKSTIELLYHIYKCPIYVHNTVNLQRHDGTIRDVSKVLITQHARRKVSKSVNTWLKTFISGLRASGQSCFLLDETRVLEVASELSLSKMIYNNELQHPAVFGQALAPTYQDIISARTLLASKKVIICDLDNTLWKGLIGEGEVEHFHHRQKILRGLREKGFLLAVCSKNDSKNVHWRGGTLTEGDFVCQKINWNPKTRNIAEIAEVLNLKSKDFVFIDDRADERALVSSIMPEVMVLDAENKSTWSQLEILLHSSPESTIGDRTLAYRQRQSRDSFLELHTVAKENARMVEIDALAQLELKLEIRLASRPDLERVTDLINRTNQFNMTGNRITLQEVEQLSHERSNGIFVAEARDRFGGMGIISTAIVKRSSRGAEISTFVLSCRVFGFGMECALLNHIKIWAKDSTLYGHFKETAHNSPCHRTYSDNGFSWNGTDWIFFRGDLRQDPPWLSVASSIV